ncbi:MAG TPA: hypothetical protein VFA43_20965 [Gemmatimonadaceae bacterium]|nr:hypothetical protein [Gemmatimonadaceae bacterium]
MTDILAERFEAIADPTDDSDWRDVRRRARLTTDRPIRPLLVAALIGAAIAAAPALAFNSSVQQFVGLKNPPAPFRAATWTRPRLVARLTGLYFNKKEPFGLPRVTVSFTVGEAGKPPGTGVTFGSYFLVVLKSRTGASTGPLLVRAYGPRGHYRATLPVPGGGIGGIEVAGWINVRQGPSEADGTFWIPVVIPVEQH